MVVRTALRSRARPPRDPRHERLPAALRTKLRRYVLPVYDYVLMTEPLSAPQRKAAIGWANRQGLADMSEPVPLLPADRRRPDPVGRLRRDLPLEQQRGSAARAARRDLLAARLAVLRDVPAAGGAALLARLGGRDRHVQPVQRVLRPRSSTASSRTPPATPGSGVGATRWGARVCLDLVDELRDRPDPAVARPQEAAAVPARAVPQRGVWLTRRALARADRREGRRGPWLKLLDAVGLGFDS